MDKQNAYYPYTENVKLIRQFFSNPTVLICTIFGMAYAVSALIPVFTSNINITTLLVADFPIGALALAEAAGLLLLYIKSFSHKFSTLKFPLTFLRVVSLASIVVLAAALLLLIINAVSAAVNASAAPENCNAYDAFVQYLLICGAAAIALCKAVFMFVWFGSAKKSVCSVYLCRKGSAMCAKFSFISAALLLAIGAFTICCEVSDFAVTSQFAADIFSVLNALGMTQMCAPAFIFNILLAITAVRYGMHIKKYTDKINIAPESSRIAEKDEDCKPLQAGENKTNEEKPPENIYEKLKDFTPQSVDFSAVKTDEYKNCPDCGTQCKAQDKFCPKCGAALGKS